MKNYFIAAVAALTLSTTAAMASGLIRPEPRPEPVVIETVADHGVELSFTTNGREINDLDDNWAVRGSYDVLSYELGSGVSTFTIYGEFGEVAANEYGTIGGELEWATALTSSVDIALTGDVAYVMTNNFDDGNVIVTPSALLSVTVTNNVDVFAEVGYSWNATNDWAQQGGYAELGLGVGVANGIRIVPSVIRSFDSANDTTTGQLGVEFSF